MPPIPAIATRISGRSPQGIRGLAMSDEAGMTSQTRSTSASPGRATRPEQQPRLPLVLAEQQDEERQEEVEDDQEQGDPLPAAARPAEVPGDLLGKVAGPDDQELGERHVGPEHDERQHQVAQVVEPAGGRGSDIGRSDASMMATTIIIARVARASPDDRAWRP